MDKVSSPVVPVSQNKEKPAVADYVNAIRLDHIAINVKNLQRTAEWYEKILGLTVYHKWENAWFLTRGPIHLGAYVAPDATPVADADRRFVMRHFALLLSPMDFIAAQVFLKAHDITYDGPKDTGIAYSIFVNDPDGYMVELTHYHAVEEG